MCSEAVLSFSYLQADIVSMDLSEDIDDWESISVDKEQWSLMVRQLEDLLVLQALLNMRDPSKERITLSVKKVLDSGRGKSK